MEIVGKNELERQASDLQKALFDFAESDSLTRKGLLLSVVSFIKEKQNLKEILDLLVDKEVQFQLESAVDKSLETPYILAGSNQEIIPWQGGVSMVALGLDGRIIGCVSKPTEGLED